MTRAPAFDLNALTPPAAAGFDWTSRMRGESSQGVRAHFGDIATPLAAFLNDSESVVGCVAWITSPRLVNSLLGKPVSFIVNKEWWLRSSDSKPKAVRDRANLARLTGGLRCRDFPAPLSLIAGKSDLIAPVRCVGHSPRGRTANNPLMHHKFAVRLEAGRPVAVWTGSFNFSVNAESSIENSVEIFDPAIAAAYLAEYARVAAVSEPMNFAAGKASPSWKQEAAAVGARKPKPKAKSKLPVGKAAPAAKPRRKPRRKASGTAKHAPTTRKRAA